MDTLYIIIIALGIIITGVGSYITIKKQGLREFAINLIVEAEKIFEYGKNSEKFNYVFEKVYEKLPSFLKFIVTKEYVINFIQKIFDDIKIALDYKDENK